MRTKSSDIMTKGETYMSVLVYFKRYLFLLVFLYAERSKF